MSINSENLLDHVYAGIRVLDLSQGIAGPYCGQILQQMGAEVVKVEPFIGDWGRHMGVARHGFTGVALACNRGKRSIALDAKADAGRELVLQMARDVDIVIQSFRPGVADRLGFGYEQVRAINPTAIYVSVSGFGLTGPYADRPGTDSVLQAFTGLMVLNADAHGIPQRTRPSIGDIACGIYAASAVGGALFSRAREGKGMHLDINLLTTLAAVQNSSILDHKIRAGRAPTALTYPQGVFETSDGHLLLFAMSNDMFASICGAIGRTDWLKDPRMATLQSRLDVGDEIMAGVAAVLKTRSTAHWIEVFRACEVLYGEIKDYDELLKDPQAAHVGLPLPFHQGALGELPYAGLPGSNPITNSPDERAPLIGEHTRTVLRGLGLGAEQIAQLERDKVVLQG